MSLKDYSSCLETGGTVNVQMNGIRSFKHMVFTVTQEKRALSAYDDKRYLIRGGLDTLPYGHYKNRDIIIKDMVGAEAEGHFQLM